VTPQSVTSDGLRAFDDSPTTVMVQVEGDPITVVEADAGHRVSNARRGAIRSDLRGTQRNVADRVRALGGKVGASYQAAYNGMKVTIAAKDVSKLESIPNVVGVRMLTPKKLDNVNGVPLIGAPQAWAGANGFAGQGMKVAIIDTGLDYTHADFAGPGTVASFDAENANDTDAPNPALVGPDAPRVKGGMDFVGDDYNADPGDPAYQPVPHPDPDPLDCNGHGSHVAGTAAGSGVLADGSTYTGPYSTGTVSSHSWKVGPGVAPKADLYGLRVFGCGGSTDVVIDAIEWAVTHDMDVINMSLGSSFGSGTDPDAVAATNAAAAGVIVVTSSGNSGHNPYMTGSPGTGTGTISVAASDSAQGFPGANIALPGGVNVQAIVANGVPVNGITAPIEVLYSGTPHDAAHISIGCDPAEYTAADVAGKIVVVQRGTCARVARAIFGQQAGAVAVIMVNNVDSLPLYEGPITENPDDGTPYNVTIPFLGVKSSDANALIAADDGSATMTDTTLTNPQFLATADFSSGGPRSGDSALKPDVTAPGVSISSAGVGTGNGAAIISGTSMASPHTAGAAALVRQAHPAWGLVKYWKAALVNTAAPNLVTDYSTRLNGAGFIQVQRAVKTQVVANGPDGTATLNYGFNEVSGQLNVVRKVTVKNFSNQAIFFAVGTGAKAGSPHTVTTSLKQIRVPARGQSTFNVTVKVSPKTVGDSTDFRDVSGLVTLTPKLGGNSGVSLVMPYYLVPRAASNVRVTLNTTNLKNKGFAPATVSNFTANVGGTADWYSWGITDPLEAGLGSNDVKAVGVQTFPDDGVIVFSLATHRRWSNAAANEFDIYLDVDADGTDDYVVVAADYGGVTAGAANGETGVFVFDLHQGGGTVEFLADAPTDSSTMALPVLIDQLCVPGSPCLSETDPVIRYDATGFGPGVPTDNPSSSATFNVFHPSLSTGMFNTLSTFGRITQSVTLDKAEFALTPALGLMVMSHDNKADNEVNLLPIP
jgi:subtilisin family serine protease